VCVDAFLNGLLVGVGCLHSFESFNVRHVGSRCFGEPLYGSSYFPELGGEELKWLKGGLRYERSGEEEVFGPQTLESQLLDLSKNAMTERA
jgi:hypothetical protein